MNIKKILFALSSVSVLALTSCGSSGFRHEISETLRAYHADLNHDGKIARFQLDDDPTHTWYDEENLTWIEAYDTLITEANSMAQLNKIANALNISTDELKRTSLARYEILHEAEELLMSTGAILPIYNYGDPYLLKPGIEGIYTMNLGYKFLDRLKYTDGRASNFTISVGTKAETFDPASNSDVSTTLAINQFLIGAKRYVQGDQEPEESAGIYQAKLTDGVCDVTKQLVTSNKTKADEDPDYIWIQDCPDLYDAVYVKGVEKAEDYEGTARYVLTVKNEAVWNDGSEILADDFIYEWTRATSGVYNGQAFGIWGSMFDMIRGYSVWDAIGQQKDMASAMAKPAWAKLSNAEKNQYEEVFNGYSNEKGTVEGLGCAGGMAGIIKNSDKQFTIQLINDCDYFESLLACPMYLPVAKKNIIIKGSEPDYEKTHICKEDTDWWKNKSGEYLTNGPMEIDGPIDNNDSGGINLKKAQHYTTGLTPALVDDGTALSIHFKFIDKDSTIYDSYKSGTLQFTNQFPNSVVDDLMKKPDWHNAQQIGLFFYSFNVNDNTFDIRKNMSEEERQYLRKAATLLVNRDDISNNVAKKGCYAANGFVSDGVMESCIPEWSNSAPSPKGGNGAYIAKLDSNGNYVTSNWHDRNLDAYSYLTKTEGDYAAHIMDKRNNNPGGFLAIADDVTTEDDAMKTNTQLAIDYAEKAGVHFDEKTGKFTNFPRLNVITNSGSGLEDIAERIQAYYGLWGIDMSIATQEWQSFLASRRIGDFAVARQGWVADYSDPRTYLDLCASYSGNNDTQLGKNSWHWSH